MKPNFKQLFAMRSSRKTIDIIVDEVGDNTEYFKEVLDIALYEKSPINWRATWGLEFICNKNPQLFIPYINLIVEEFPNLKIDGQKRVFPKIIEKFIDKLSEENIVNLIDICFEYLMSEKEKVAVKVNCMQVLFEISKINKEILGELQAVIELESDNNTVAFEARARMILKKINKIH